MHESRMKSLLFIGYSMHLKTLSAEPVLRVLEEQYEVTNCYIDLDEQEPYARLKQIRQKCYDVLVCWQVMPPRQLLNQLFKFTHGVFFPMLDGCPSVRKTEKWWPYRDFMIICFAKLLERRLHQAGFSARYIQYFPKPSETLILGESDSVFFWYRREEINSSLVEHLFENTGVKRIHLHNSPDPWVSRATNMCSQRYEYTSSVWYDTKAQLNEVIAQSAYYVAPRVSEGIGMSFLEAMALGKCVVAPNRATMNEYIAHGRTGLLYDIDAPEPLEVGDVADIQRTTFKFMHEGYQQWLQRQNEMLRWCEMPVKIVKWRVLLFMVRRFFTNPLKLLRSLSF